MDSEQMIRAAAAQAVAALMAPVQPLPAAYVATCDVVAAYIRSGRDAAFELCLALENVNDVPAAKPTPVAEPVTMAVPVASVEASDSPTTPAAVSEPADQGAEVIPIVARAPVPGKQDEARRFVEKRRKSTVDSLLAQAGVAKALAHKERLFQEAEEAGLLDYYVTVNDENTTLGAYLKSL